ncbi:MAG: PIN domain-containing protein [Candidatus Eremiobacterota bacterium]
MLAVLQAFLRLLTNRTIMEEPYPAGELFEVVDEWWTRPGLLLLAPTERTYAIFRDLMVRYDLSGSAATDALIAAFAIEHQGKLLSNDTDFLRFEELEVENPLANQARWAPA